MAKVRALNVKGLVLLVLLLTLVGCQNPRRPLPLHALAADQLPDAR
jgi:hypothetical protein